jgi:putative DNA primase/helicase
LLDGFVKKRKDTNKKGEALPGSEIVVEDPDPWGDPVDGPDTLAQVSALLRRFIIFKYPTDAEMVSLWMIGTYLSFTFNIFPRLGVFSPESECGKTTVLDVLSHLVCRAIRSDNLTTATCFRAMELFRPTLLLDELDTFLLENQELIGILNSGHKQGGYVLRMEKSGDKQELRKFGTFGACVYGMIAPP